MSAGDWRTMTHREVVAFTQAPVAADPRVWTCAQCGHGSSDPRDAAAHTSAHDLLARARAV